MVNQRHLIGQRFGRLAVLERGRSKTGLAGWVCLCICGNRTIVTTSNLTRGHTTSCGCYRLQTNGKASITHGMSRSKEWHTWKAMKRRCYASSDKRFERYGARGIGVCKRWHKFENFYADMGPKPVGMSLDRKDNNKGYSKANCRWADNKTQSRNRSTNNRITIKGETLILSEWCERYSVKYTTVIQRFRRGWSPIEAITIPKGERP